METVYYTPKEVAERLKLRVQTVYEYIRKGRLPAVRLGNRCRIAQSDLEAFLERPVHTGPSAVSGAQDPRRPVFPEEAQGARSLGRGAKGTAADAAASDQADPVERNKAAMRLLAEWMADESGYDEQVWPTVERLLSEHPVAFAGSLRE